jgi:hypothetical protein
MNGNGKDAREHQDAALRRRRVEESLHFAAATVKPQASLCIVAASSS